jgi:tetratricopeptide (TPR) repeat protein
MKKELSNINGFFWQGYNQLAAYCVANNVHMDDAAAWADRSIQINKTFANLNTKAKILEKQGRQTEADALRKEGLSLADETQLNAYGYELLGKGNTKEAIDIFKMNIKQYPNSWNVYDSLGEALLMTGNKKEAMENYKMALAKAPANQKSRIEGIIQKM